ncbi:unnamed protein product [Nezara viridula]|uniref:RCC1-like domain-containing protein n=1 Tax=Nezara viridula TaxID=85310 RepID=A0A9P0H7A1_NEZVI|nr:unnamed protein product [Nezara viridula]
MSRPTKRKSNAVTKAPKPKKIAKTGNKFIAEEGLNRVPGCVLVIGEGIAGQLGLGIDISEKSKPAVVPDLNNVIEIAAGGMHSICLTADSKVITFGCNDEGALGRDTSEEGTEAIPGEVELPGKVIQVSAGDSHSAALLDNGQVYIWGTFRDEHGSMGLLKNDVIEKNPVLLESKVRFLRIASGSNHVVLLDEYKHVNTFGCGEQGQLGRLSERASSRDSRKGLGQLLTPAVVPFKNRPKFEIVDVWAGNMCTFIKDNKELIHVFGLNNYKQLGVEKGRIMFHPVQSSSFNEKNWVKVAIGQHHTIALDSEGQVYALGRHEYGRLGLGADCTDADVPTLVKIPNDEKCSDISCGSTASFAVTESGKLYSWGMEALQLGVGDGDKVEPTLVTGKQLEKRDVIKVAAGAQHTIIIAKDKAV